MLISTNKILISHLDTDFIPTFCIDLEIMRENLGWMKT